MSDPTLTPATPVAAVEDNPAKPWKAFAAAALAFVVVFIVLVVKDDKKLTAEDLAQYLGLAAALSGLPGVGTYAVKNPKRRKQQKRKHSR